MITPCRTTQHCAYHGWCRRCNPALADLMSEINLIIQRGCTEPERHGPMYTDIAAIVHAAHTREEETVGELNRANIRLARELAASNVQLGQYLTQLHQEGKHTGEHVYLSTGCHHGGEGHDYCQSMTGIQGAKRGGKCKWCNAQCICHCHAKGPECTASVSGDCLKEMESETACDTASGECVHGGQPATDTAETTKKASLQNLRCNHAQTHWSHIPHDWEPQPGMDKVHCVGHPEGACDYACPLDAPAA